MSKDIRASAERGKEKEEIAKEKENECGEEQENAMGFKEHEREGGRERERIKIERDKFKST